ncbi:MAG: glutamine synthetase family protein [Actinomycetota bacterium]
MTAGFEPLARRAGVDTPERRARIAEIAEEITARGLTTVRLAFADVHGILRGKALRADLALDAFADGAGITSALLMKDTGQLNVYPVWAEGGGLDRPWLTGAGDVLMLPDPSTFRVLPWADGTGWVLCDLFGPDGETIDLATRSVCREAERRLAVEGYEMTAGLEVEFHLYRIDDVDTATTGPPPAASDGLRLAHTHPGRVYLGEQRFDLVEPFLELLRNNLTTLGLPPRSLEIELGPSQVEVTFSPGGALQTADDAVLLRSAIKQIARRHGLHATFMSRPPFPASFTSGWHLHQSLVDSSSGANAFTTDEPGRLLSDVGRHHLAGLLANAAPSCLLTTPTITGYKRYQPAALAPFRATWARQNRGAMLRLVGGGADPATRIENRVGDSAANPYLYVTAQLTAGLAGIADKADPPAATDTPYEAEAGPALPTTLGDAITAFSGSEVFREALGDGFVDYLAGIKQAEWDRFLRTVTDWEHTEYLELF